jgi:hypothetical protein
MDARRIPRLLIDALLHVDVARPARPLIADGTDVASPEEERHRFDPGVRSP